jgi:toxin ParE1/3/4
VSKPQIYRLKVRPEAETEIQDAALWYEEQSRGLGREFLRAFRAATAPLRRNPLLYRRVLDESRRVLLRRFPYAVMYEIQEPEVVILACIHCARDPELWERRISR